MAHNVAPLASISLILHPEIPWIAFSPLESFVPELWLKTRECTGTWDGQWAEYFWETHECKCSETWSGRNDSLYNFKNRELDFIVQKTKKKETKAREPNVLVSTTFSEADQKRMVYILDNTHLFGTSYMSQPSRSVEYIMPVKIDAWWWT